MTEVLDYLDDIIEASEKIERFTPGESVPVDADRELARPHHATLVSRSALRIDCPPPHS